MFKPNLIPGIASPPLRTPQNEYALMKEKYTNLGKLKQFIKFQHITKHPFVRKFLLKRNLHRCAICSRPIYDFRTGITVHHLSYDHCCENDDAEEIKVYIHRDPPANVPPASAKFYNYTYAYAPNCEYCYNSAPKLFASCMNNLCLAHSKCHIALHQSQNQKIGS